MDGRATGKDDRAGGADGFAEASPTRLAARRRAAPARQSDRRGLALRVEREALNLFLEAGYDATTVDEIARAAGTSRRTFFRYYASKADVFNASLRRRYDDVAKEMQRRPRFEPTFTAVCESFLANAEFTAEELELIALGRRVLDAHPELALRIRERSEPAAEQLIRLAGERLGLDPDSDPTPDLLVGIVRAAAQSAQREWVERDFEPDLRDLMRARFSLLHGAQVLENAAALERRRARDALG